MDRFISREKATKMKQRGRNSRDKQEKKRIREKSLRCPRLQNPGVPKEDMQLEGPNLIRIF